MNPIKNAVFNADLSQGEITTTSDRKIIAKRTTDGDGDWIYHLTEVDPTSGKEIADWGSAVIDRPKHIIDSKIPRETIEGTIGETIEKHEGQAVQVAV